MRPRAHYFKHNYLINFEIPPDFECSHEQSNFKQLMEQIRATTEDWPTTPGMALEPLDYSLHACPVLALILITRMNYCIR